MQSKTGTSNKEYDLISLVYHCLQAVDTCEIYKKDCQGDQETLQLINQCQEYNRQLAEKGKKLLSQCLMVESR